MLLPVPAKAGTDGGREGGLFLHPALELFNQVNIRLGAALGHIRADHKETFAIAALDLAEFGRRGAGDEMCQRHRPAFGRDFQLIQSGEQSEFFREACADFDLVIAVIGAVGAKQRAPRHQLDKRAHDCHIRAKPPGGGAVDGDLPLDAGQGAGVVNADQLGDCVEMGAGDLGRGVESLPVGGFQLKLDWFALLGAFLLS